MKRLLLLILLALGLPAAAQQTCFGSSCSSSGSSTITPSTPTSGFTANTLIRTDGTNFLSGPKYASTGDLSLLFGVNRCMDSGGSDAYSCALSGGSLTAYGTGGLQITLRATTANTGTATLDVDSLGAKTITRSDGTTLQTGDITAGMYVGLVYDGTNFRAAFRSGSIISPAGGVTIRSDTYASGSDVGLTVQGSLSGNMQNWKNSAGTNLLSLSSGANLIWPSGSPSLQVDEPAGILTFRVGGATNNNKLILDANSGDSSLSSYTQRHKYTLSWSAASTSTINSGHIFDTSPGNTSAGFGTGLLIRGQSSTTASQDMVRIAGRWSDATHATRSSDVVIQTVSSASALSDREAILGKYTTLTEGAATTFARVNIPTSTVSGGVVEVTVEANDATDFQSRTLTVPWSSANKAGTLGTTGIGTPSEAFYGSAGTLTCTLTLADAGSGNLDFQANCTSSLTQTVLRANAQVRKNFGTGAISAQ